MEHIRHYVLIKAPVEKVYEAITTQQGLANWWTRQTVAKPEVGFLNEFGFGEEYLNKMRIEELVPSKLVKWSCEGQHEEWTGTPLTFELQQKDEDTVLRFAHSDWKEATEFYENCNYHWAYFLHSLKKLCETGKGHPFPEMD